VIRFNASMKSDMMAPLLSASSSRCR